MFPKHIIIGVALIAIVTFTGWLSWRFYLNASADEVVFSSASAEKCVSETASSDSSEYDSFARKNSGLFFIQPPKSVYTGQRFTINVVYDKNFMISSSDSTKKLLTLLKQEWENPAFDFTKNPVTILERVSGSATLYPLKPDYSESQLIINSETKIENPVRLDQTSKLANQVLGNTGFDQNEARGVSYFMVGTSPTIAGELRLNVYFKDLEGTTHKIGKICVEVNSLSGAKTTKEETKSTSESKETTTQSVTEKTTGGVAEEQGSSTPSPISQVVSSVPKCPPGATFDEEYAISTWLSANQDKLNRFGDPKETVYTGDTPLFDEKTGKEISLYDYVIKKHPDKPWRQERYCKTTSPSPSAGPEKPLQTKPEPPTQAMPVSSSSPSPTSKSAQPSVIKGDLDSDGKVTILDRDLAVKIATGLITPTAAHLKAGDLDSDGKITVKDATLIAQMLNPASGTVNKPASLSTFPGDLNADNKLDSADVQILLDIASKKITPSEYQKNVGDINKDGKITSADATLLLQTINSLNDSQLGGTRGDVNGDGKVTKEDLDLVEKMISKVVSPTDRQLKSADLNDDGNITTEDAKLLESLISKETPLTQTQSAKRVYLRPGSKHPEIKAMKEILKDAGLYKGEVDENFDSAFSSALKDFQSSRGIRVTGKLNAATVAELNKISANKIQAERPSFVRTIIEKILMPIISPLLKFFRG